MRSSIAKILTLRAAFPIATCIVALSLCGCGDERQAARRAIHKKSFPYTIETLTARASAGDHETVSQFLAAGAPYPLALRAASIAGHKIVVDKILSTITHPSERSTALELALFSAIDGDKADLVNYVIDRGASVESVSRAGPPFLHALRKNKISAAKVLLAKGSDPKATAWDGYSPLMAAARSGDADLVNVILSKGADPRAVSMAGFTPIHEAALSGNAAIVQALVQAGADINSGSKGRGYTPLHLVTAAGKPDLVDMFIAKGADFNRADADGREPIRIAELAGNEPLLTKFRSMHYAQALKEISKPMKEQAAIDLMVAHTTRVGAGAAPAIALRNLLLCTLQRRHGYAIRAWQAAFTQAGGPARALASDKALPPRTFCSTDGPYFIHEKSPQEGFVECMCGSPREALGEVPADFVKQASEFVK